MTNTFLRFRAAAEITDLDWEPYDEGSPNREWYVGPERTTFDEALADALQHAQLRADSLKVEYLDVNPNLLSIKVVILGSSAMKHLEDVRNHLGE